MLGNSVGRGVSVDRFFFLGVCFFVLVGVFGSVDDFCLVFFNVFVLFSPFGRVEHNI